MSGLLPRLPAELEPTRSTLRAYAHAVGRIPRTHAVPHPAWWHISLEVHPNGLLTDPMPLPDGGACHLRMDLNRHAVVLETSHGTAVEVSMTEGLSGPELGERLVALAADLGLEGEYTAPSAEDVATGGYDPEVATGYFAVLTAVRDVFTRHRHGLPGSYGPVQLWPHHFDLAFEWYGTKRVSHEEHGEVAELPAQLNLGFSPEDRPYFYSNPWPFATDVLVGHELPSGAAWHTDGWEGTVLYYDLVAGRDDGAGAVLAYARTVFDLAAPTLTSA